MKKTLCCILSLVLLLMTAIPALAAGAGRPRLVISRDAVSADGVIPVPENISEEIDWDAVFTALRSAVLSRADVANLYSFRIPNTPDNASYITHYLLYEPDLLKILGNTIHRSNVTVNGESFIYEIKLKDYYLYTAEEYAAMVAACEDAKTQLLYGIKDNVALSDAEKCLLLHDRLAAWCGYDKANYIAHTVPNESYSAYGPLVLHIGVCEGISMAYGWMLDQLGIENTFISSETIGHGWNMVYLDNEPYFVDVTWDDPTWDVYGRVNHGNMLQSFDTFSANHKATDFTGAPVSARYEDADWVTGTTEIQLIDNKLYYLDGSPYFSQIQDNEGELHPAWNKADLNCLDLATGTVTKIREVTGENNYSSLFIPGKGTCFTSVRTRMAAIGTKLYYSTASEIRVYDSQTGMDEFFYAPDFTQYETGSKIIGFTQRNGTFYVSVSQSDNVDGSSNTGTVETVPFCTGHADKITLETLTPATCAQGGEIKFLCADCRAIGTAETDPDPALHVFGEWTTVTAATCTAGGSERRDCANCDAFETRETGVDASNHVNTEDRPAVAATCVAQGRQAGVWCLDCQKFVSGGEAINPDPDAHTFGAWTAVTASTCSVKGTERRDCADCDAFETRETALDPANHVNTETRPAVAATCVDPGREAGVYCLDCRKYVSGGTETAVDPANHVNTEEKAAVAPTCTKEGREAGVYCNDCKQYVSGGETVGKLAHEYTAAVTEPTCTKSGYTTYTCQNCSDSYVSDQTAALGHTDADGDQRCDRCNADLSPEANCSCNCHKGGLLGFLFKVKVFFCKLFGLTQYRYCECGKAHW